MVEVAPASYHSKDWDLLIKTSHQTSLYVMPEWMDLYKDANEVLIAYRGTSPVAGMVIVKGWYPLPFCPYQGTLLLRKEDHEAVTELAKVAEDHGAISVWNCPAMVDVRDFYWRGYQRESQWLQAPVKYTYLCTPDSKLDNRVRAQITGSDITLIDLKDFLKRWREEPWVNEEDWQWMSLILQLPSVSCMADPDAGVVFGVDLQGRGYYLASYGSPANILAYLIRGHDSFEMVGANSPQRDLFKKGFGGTKRTYYGVRFSPKGD